MTKDEILSLAKESGAVEMQSSLTHPNGPTTSIRFSWTNGSLERFASLVAEKEREAGAKVCDSWTLRDSLAADIAKEIRARGKSDKQD